MSEDKSDEVKVKYERVQIFEVYTEDGATGCIQTPEANTYQLYGFLKAFIKSMEMDIVDKLNDSRRELDE
jgi:hypothetical protein